MLKLYKKYVLLEAQILLLVSHMDKPLCGTRINLFHYVTPFSKSCTYLVQLSIEVQSLFFHLPAIAFWCLSTERRVFICRFISLDPSLWYLMPAVTEWLYSLPFPQNCMKNPRWSGNYMAYIIKSVCNCVTSWTLCCCYVVFRLPCQWEPSMVKAKANAKVFIIVGTVQIHVWLSTSWHLTLF